MGEPTTPQQDRLPAAEEAFAERLAPLLEMVERWRARIAGEAGRWPPVPLSGLGPDDPHRLAAEIAEELLRAHGHLVAAEERVRSAAALRRQARGPDRTASPARSHAPPRPAAKRPVTASLPACTCRPPPPPRR